MVTQLAVRFQCPHKCLTFFWCCRDEPSSAQRQVAFDTMQLYQALHTQALAGIVCAMSCKRAPTWLSYYSCCLNCCCPHADQDRTARLQSILEYSQEIAAVLRAACGRSVSHRSCMFALEHSSSKLCNTFSMSCVLHFGSHPQCNLLSNTSVYMKACLRIKVLTSC